MKVKNLNGTAELSCKCSSWLEHWSKFTGKNRNTCSNVFCFSDDIIGAHVQKYNLLDNKWYIVPLCKKCNKSDSIIDINDVELVPANVNNTCG